MKLIKRFIAMLTFKNLETDVEIVNRLFDDLAYEQFKIDLIYKEIESRSELMNKKYNEIISNNS